MKLWGIFKKVLKFVNLPLNLIEFWLKLSCQVLLLPIPRFFMDGARWGDSHRYCHTGVVDTTAFGLAWRCCL
jgi:hypothetical protein